MNPDAFGNPSQASPSAPKAQFSALGMFSIIVLFFFAGYISRSCLLPHLALHLNDNLHWPVLTIGLWYGVLSSGIALAFIGGFLGDRTLKRKDWIWIGLLVEGTGILLLSMHSTPAAKAGIALVSLGLLLFLGNIYVVVADCAGAAGIRLETAFLVVFFSAGIADLFGPILAATLFNNALLYPALTMVTITFGLLLLLAAHYVPESGNPDSVLNPSSAWRRRMVLLIAFLAIRGLNFSGKYAFSWSGDSGDISESIVDQLGNIPLIVSVVCILVVPVIILLITRWLHRRNTSTAGLQLVSIGLALTGLALLIVGSGAGDLLPKNHILLVITIVLMFMSAAFLFTAMAALACTLVTNRWRGTVTVLFAGVPAGMDITPLSWESWPLAAPLLITGAGILISALLWHLLVVNRLATNLISQDSLKQE